MAVKTCLMIGAGGMAGGWINRFVKSFGDRVKIVGLVDVKEEVLRRQGEALGLADDRLFTDYIEAIDKVKADFPEYSALPGGLRHIGKTYEKAGKLEEAKSIYQKLISDYPDYEGLLNVQKHLLYILVKEGAETQGILDKLVEDYSQDPYLAVVLYDIALRHELVDKYTEARNIFQRIGQLCPDRAIGSDALAKTVDYFVAGDYQQALATIDKFITDFGSDSQSSHAVFSIGERYYRKAFQLEQEGLSEQANDYFLKAATIFDKVPDMSSVSHIMPRAPLLAGECYRKRGEWQKAIDRYQLIVDKWPDNIRAWKAMFHIGHLNEKLKNSGELFKSEADAKTKAAYEQHVEKYPDCPAARHARSWLNSNSSK